MYLKVQGKVGMDGMEGSVGMVVSDDSDADDGGGGDDVMRSKKKTIFRCRLSMELPG